MKSLIQAVVVAVAISAPLASFAQSNAPVTRAQVRAELAQLEKAGYRVGDGDNTHYPEGIQAAEARVAVLPDKTLRRVGEALSRWTLTPNGTEGYRKAEVTRGGVDTRDLSSSTMMSATSTCSRTGSTRRPP